MVANWHTVKFAESIPFPVLAGEGLRSGFDTDLASISSSTDCCSRIAVTSVGVS